MPQLRRATGRIVTCKECTITCIDLYIYIYIYNIPYYRPVYMQYKFTYFWHLYFFLSHERSFCDRLFCYTHKMWLLTPRTACCKVVYGIGFYFSVSKISMYVIFSVLKRCKKWSHIAQRSKRSTRCWHDRFHGLSLCEERSIAILKKKPVVSPSKRIYCVYIREFIQEEKMRQKKILEQCTYRLLYSFSFTKKNLPKTYWEYTEALSENGCFHACNYHVKKSDTFSIPHLEIQEKTKRSIECRCPNWTESQITKGISSTKKIRIKNKKKRTRYSSLQVYQLFVWWGPIE